MNNNIGANDAKAAVDLKKKTTSGAKKPASKDDKPTSDALKRTTKDDNSTLDATKTTVNEDEATSDAPKTTFSSSSVTTTTAAPNSIELLSTTSTTSLSRPVETFQLTSVITNEKPPARTLQQTSTYPDKPNSPTATTINPPRDSVIPTTFTAPRTQLTFRPPKSNEKTDSTTENLYLDSVTIIDNTKTQKAPVPIASRASETVENTTEGELSARNAGIFIGLCIWILISTIGIVIYVRWRVRHRSRDSNILGGEDRYHKLNASAPPSKQSEGYCADGSRKHSSVVGDSEEYSTMTSIGVSSFKYPDSRYNAYQGTITDAKYLYHAHDEFDSLVPQRTYGIPGNRYLTATPRTLTAPLRCDSARWNSIVTATSLTAPLRYDSAKWNSIFTIPY
jgi:hypothetical protein